MFEIAVAFCDISDALAAISCAFLAIAVALFKMAVLLAEILLSAVVIRSRNADIAVWLASIADSFSFMSFLFAAIYTLQLSIKALQVSILNEFLPILPALAWIRLALVVILSNNSAISVSKPSARSFKALIRVVLSAIFLFKLVSRLLIKFDKYVF